MKQIRALLLAAGLGTRLRPVTDDCPKCLIPIGGRPLLEHWLCTLYKNDICNVLVNVHHHRNLVESFLSRKRFRLWVSSVYEANLLGTAGTLRKNISYFKDCTVLLVHADNWCQCDFEKFVEFHTTSRPAGTAITMMTFRTPTPSTCGIVELDSKGIVTKFHEKVSEPPGNLANGAVYLFESEVLDWIMDNDTLNDFSTEVLPQFIGRIATWENKGIHRDIGQIESLLEAQHDQCPISCWPDSDEWDHAYKSNPVHDCLTRSKNG